MTSKDGSDTQIGRVHSINPVAGEVYFLRVLLHDPHCQGKTSFQHMKVVPSGRQCETFKDVCFELGLLNDDLEWQRILDEAAATQMCQQIRELYVIILIWCMPSNPLALFAEFWPTWTDDLQRRANRSGIQLSEENLKTLVLLDIEERLESYEKTLLEYGLPVPSKEERDAVESLEWSQ